MRPTWVLVALLSCTPLIEAILRLKLQHWFPRYEQRWIEASSSCQQELSNYFHTNRTADCPWPCACAADCILQNVTSTMQSDFASAQVLLGLVPTMLVYFGPTTVEVASLSTYRPLLAVLLALGSPAVKMSGLFRHVDVREPFVQPISKTSMMWSKWLARQNVMVRTSWQALCYVAALAAIANNVQTSVYTDLRTISGWRCGALFMPLVWSLLAVVVHAWGMIAVRVRLGNGYKPSIRSTIQSMTFRRVLSGKDGVLSEFLFWLASLYAIIHMIFGVLELSSLLFIGALEALQVFVKYAASAILCQFILLLELANMRYELSREADPDPPSNPTTVSSKK